MPSIDWQSYPVPPEFAEYDPIGYALEIIDWYQSEIETGIAKGTIPLGFCQGRIFLNAKARILSNAVRCGLRLKEPKSSEG